jgi:hypothetical protein
MIGWNIGLTAQPWRTEEDGAICARAIPLKAPWIPSRTGLFTPTCALAIPTWMDATRQKKGNTLRTYAWTNMWPISATVASSLWVGLPKEMDLSLTETVGPAHVPTVVESGKSGIEAAQPDRILPPEGFLKGLENFTANIQKQDRTTRSPMRKDARRNRKKGTRRPRTTDNETLRNNGRSETSETH